MYVVVENVGQLSGKLWRKKKVSLSHIVITFLPYSVQQNDCCTRTLQFNKRLRERTIVLKIQQQHSKKMHFTDWSSSLLSQFSLPFVPFGMKRESKTCSKKSVFSFLFVSGAEAGKMCINTNTKSKRREKPDHIFLLLSVFRFSLFSFMFPFIRSCLSSSVFCETNWHVFRYVDCVRSELTVSFILHVTPTCIVLFRFSIFVYSSLAMSQNSSRQICADGDDDCYVPCTEFVWAAAAAAPTTTKQKRTTGMSYCKNCIQTYVVTCYMFAFAFSLPLVSHMRFTRTRAH